MLRVFFSLSLVSFSMQALVQVLSVTGQDIATGRPGPGQAATGDRPPLAARKHHRPPGTGTGRHRPPQADRVRYGLPRFAFQAIRLPQMSTGERIRTQEPYR